MDSRIFFFQIIPEPSMPEWTAEARDVQELVQVLTTRYEKARLKVEDVKEKQKDNTIIMVPSNVSYSYQKLFILKILGSYKFWIELFCQVWKDLVRDCTVTVLAIKLCFKSYFALL